MVDYDRTDVFQGIDVNKANESKEYNICDFGIFYIKVLSFKGMFTMILMIY